MSRRILREETGMTLIAAVLIVFGMLAFGLAMLAASDTQSRTTARERTREASFNLSEAALNAQALQLSRTWPAGNVPICTPTVVHATCPDAAAIGGGYSTGDYAATPCVTAPTIPAWQTSVYDNTANEAYWTQTIATSARPNFDANGDGVLWLRAAATTRCHTVAVVSQVSQQTIPIAFPSNIVTANWIQTSNQGKKVIVDTLGSGGQPAPVVARCAGLSTAQCLNYPAGKGQIQPPAVRSDSGASPTTLTTSQLAALQAQAVASGSYLAGCPTSMTQLTSPANGAPVYIKNCAVVSIGGNTQVNSAAKPGALIIETGTLSMGGTSNFYGLVYMVNKSNISHPTPVVNIQGNAQIYGVVSVDGNGGILAGSSKANLVNDPRAVSLLRGSSGARVNKNTFRVVPAD